MTYETRYQGLREALRGLDMDALVPNVGYLDQLRSATRDTRATLDTLGTLERVLAPDRDWHGPLTNNEQEALIDIQARVLACIGEGDWTFCEHLRRNNAQPTIVALPLRRSVCYPCSQTMLVRPPPGDGDRCDFCGSRGHETFWPLRLTLTSWLVIGDACRSCATALRSHVGLTT